MGNGTFEKICDDIFDGQVRGAAAHRVASPIMPQCGADAGINDWDLTDLEIVPNPVADEMTIKLPAGPQNLRAVILNGLGQTVLMLASTSGQTLMVDTRSLASGIYYLRLTAGNQTVTKKFVKQ